MNTITHTTRRARSLIAGLATAALLTTFTACQSQGGDGADAVDAEQWYQEYEEESYEDGAGGGSMPSAATDDSGAPPPSEVEPTEPGLLDDNTFRDAGTRGFTDARQDATSTFGLDVDTGSWGIARTLLEQGQQVPPASIRAEEWINAQPYDDPAPTDDDLGVTSTTVQHPGLDEAELTRIAVGARDVEMEDLPPLNVTLVVDRSGSMDIRSRLGLVQTSLGLMAEHLRPQDSLSVVGFDDEVRTVLEPTPVSETETIVNAIDELTPGGGTNLSGGLERGYDVARQAYEKDAVNVVVLASDGVANVGPTGPGSIVDRIQEEGADGIHLVTVGFGMGNYNDHLMEQLADRGDGFYAYVDTVAEARKLFVEDLNSTLTPVATEAKSQVEFDPELVESWRQVGYENRQLTDEQFDDPTVDAGEVGAGHRVQALYEVRVRDGVEPGTVIGTATVRWTPVGGGKTQEVRTDIVAADPGREPDDATALAALVSDFALVMKGGEVAAGRDLSLEDLRERAQELADADVDGAEDVRAMIMRADGMDPYPVD